MDKETYESLLELLKKADTRLAHIESLLQRMPEMAAAAYFIEEERKNRLGFGKSYSDSVILCPTEER